MIYSIEEINKKLNEILEDFEDDDVIVRSEIIDGYLDVVYDFDEGREEHLLIRLHPYSSFYNDYLYETFYHYEEPGHLLLEYYHSDDVENLTLDNIINFIFKAVEESTDHGIKFFQYEMDLINKIKKHKETNHDKEKCME